LNFIGSLEKESRSTRAVSLYTLQLVLSDDDWSLTSLHDDTEAAMDRERGLDRFVVTTVAPGIVTIGIEVETTVILALLWPHIPKKLHILIMKLYF
jgi:hypothetical protein